ncbi:MAG: N-glycosylase/DNA lyase [Candidatus Altiarchaeota archaeon]
MSELLAEHAVKKGAIKKRLSEFKAAGRQSDERVFEELCFCLLTPQSKARSCDRAVRQLKSERLLPEGSKARIAAVLKKSGVRFHNNKASYIIEARRTFSGDGRLGINDVLKSFENDELARDWLVRNVKGLGYKEASHFMRNVGRGSDVAILDRHIMKNLKAQKVIRWVPNTITRKRYFQIEGKVRDYCRKIGIPMDELDLLFWSIETGEVFK